MAAKEMGYLTSQSHVDSSVDDKATHIDLENAVAVP